MGNWLQTFWDSLSVPLSRAFFDCLTLDDGMDRLPHNVGKQLPHHAAYHSLREKASIRRQRKSEISQNKQEFPGMKKPSAELHCRFIHFNNEECTLSSRTEILSEILSSSWYSKALRVSLLQASISGGNANLNTKVQNPLKVCFQNKMLRDKLIFYVKHKVFYSIFSLRTIYYTISFTVLSICFQFHLIIFNCMSM